MRRAYDAQLRGESELANATSVDVDPPVFRAVFSSDSGFATHRSLDELEGHALDALIVRTITYFRDATEVDSFEWKTRGHDTPHDFTDRLIAHGFEPEDPETVMIGAAELLCAGAALPPGLRLRRIGFDAGGDPSPLADVAADVARMHAMQTEVFGRHSQAADTEFASALLADPHGREAWVVESDRDIVCTGRLELVEGTEFAGLWGGATHPDWRGLGLYRALTAARARSAVAKGVSYLFSDCTEHSRPILERAGLVAVTTTTPYIWRRA